LVNTVNPLASLVSRIPLYTNGFAVDVAARGRFVADLVAAGRLADGVVDGRRPTTGDGLGLVEVAEGLVKPEDGAISKADSKAQ
jgi:hypothetical protein